VYIMNVDTCSKLLSVLQVSTTGKRHPLAPPGQMIPVALLRLPAVPHVRHPFNGKEGFGGKISRQNPLFELSNPCYFLICEFELLEPLMETGW
jgi:hypothetical protein